MDYQTSRETVEQRGEGESYVKIDVKCPVCEGELWPDGEKIPQSFDYHEVAVVCDDCGLRFTVEYRAIDISWQNPVHEQHSAVSQGLIEASERDYCKKEMYPPLPPLEALKAVDWPIGCECGEVLTPNQVLAGPDAVETIEENADPSEDGTPVLLLCPVCEEETIVYAD